MEILQPVVLFLMRNTLLLFLIAFGFGLGAQFMFRKGDFAKAKVFAWIGFCGSSLLAVLYVGVTILSSSPINLIFAALWCYFAYRDWRLLQMMRTR